MTDMQREAWLSMLLSELPDRLFVLDQHGHFIESFGGTFHSTRLDTGNQSDRSLFDLLAQDKAESLVASIKEVVRSQEAKVIQYGVTATDCLQLSIEELENSQLSEEAWFEATIKPLPMTSTNSLVLWQERDITCQYVKQQELKRLSETDELTGVLNRRAFLLDLEKAFHTAKDVGSHLSCLMVDIDHFKEINDQVGHLSGDEVINQVAQICQTHTRNSDHIGRLGGEEFGIVLTHTNAINAFEIAERIREAVSATPCHVDGHTIHPTVSIGVAELSTQVSSVRELLVQADKAMYYSKQTGRDQVTIYHDNLISYKASVAMNSIQVKQAS